MAGFTQYDFIRRAAASSTLFGIDPALPGMEMYYYAKRIR
jgi:hypothetical protein